MLCAQGKHLAVLGGPYVLWKLNWEQVFSRQVLCLLCYLSGPLNYSVLFVLWFLTHPLDKVTYRKVSEITTLRNVDNFHRHTSDVFSLLFTKKIVFVGGSREIAWR